VLLLGGQVALWAVLQLPALAAVRVVRRGVTPLRLVSAGLLALGILTALLLAQDLRDRPHYAIPHFVAKSDILLAVSVAAWIPSTVAILALNGILVTALGRGHPIAGRLDGLVQLVDGPEEEPPNLAQRYLQLREVLQRSLTVLAAVVGAGILALGALRNAIVGWASTREDAARVPLELVLGYGLFWSVFLAALFVPTSVRLQALGNALADRYAPTANPAVEGWEAAAERRRRLAELLRLDVTPLAAFQAGAVILAPLASSVISVTFQSS
jgi:hypothetical protein